MVFFRVHVSAVYFFCGHWNDGELDASLLAPMISTTAESDSEIGARLGICFTFTGIGGLIGKGNMHSCKIMHSKFGLQGTPIAGALLTTSFIWWRPTIFSGLCVFFGATSFLTSRTLLARRKNKQLL